jgi:hypothetical protein
VTGLVIKAVLEDTAPEQHHTFQHLQDKRLTFDEWKESDLKAKCPFGQLPILQLDGGKCLAQSAAIGKPCADTCLHGASSYETLFS